MNNIHTLLITLSLSLSLYKLAKEDHKLLK